MLASILPRRGRRSTDVSCRNFGSYKLWHLVVCPAVQGSASSGLVNAAPLLEKECYLFPAANIQNCLDPALLHRTGTVATFSADNRPINTGYIEFPDILKQRLNGKKLHRSRRRAQMFDPRKAISLVFYADAPPDMTLLSGKPEL